MKKILTCIVLAFAASGLVGCYEDKSTYATDLIPDIVLTDTETTAIYTGYLEQIDFAPELTQDGKVLEDNDNYTYTWELNEVPDENQFQTISTERELHVTVPNGISTTPYLLKLTVKDTENDLEYLFWWDLYIQSAFLDGLVISDTKDGATSDLTLVLNQKLTTNYAGKEEKIFRNILASGSSAAAGDDKHVSPGGEARHVKEGRPVGAARREHARARQVVNGAGHAGGRARDLQHVEGRARAAAD